MGHNNFNNSEVLMRDLLKRIEKIEALIAVYNNRDRVRTKQLENQLRVLNALLLDIMSHSTLEVA